MSAGCAFRPLSLADAPDLLVLMRRAEGGLLWDLTVAVDPEYQGRGLARGLFEALIASAEAATPRVERIELVVREGLAHAIRLYERMGFRVEGRFERRFRLSDGRLEADLPMALLL